MRTLLKIFLIILIALAVYVYVEYRKLQLNVMIGVALANHAKAYEQHPAQFERNILVLGDSTGVGVGAGDPQLSLAGRLGSDYPRADITNRAVSGAKVRDVVSQFDGISGQHFDLVYIQIGGNDIVRFTKFSEVEQELERIVEIATQHGDEVVIATSGNIGTAQIFPRGTRWLMRIRTQQVREIFMVSVPEENVHYVDLYREPNDDPFAADPAKHYAEDSFHPSSDGYGVWYERIQPVIRALPGWEK